MTATMTFALAAAALVVVALGIVVAPLLRQSTRVTRLAALAAVVALPSITAATYVHLGAPAVLEAQPLLDARSRHDVEGMLSALERKLQVKPDDAEGWYTLGRSYVALDRMKDAVTALEKASALAPTEARYLSQYAESLGMTSPDALDGKPMELIERALELDPNDEKALELAGIQAFHKEQLALAVHYWRRLLKRLPAQSEFHEEIKLAIEKAETMLAGATGLGDRARLRPPEKVKGESPH